MPIQISLKKSTTDPNGASGLTLGEPVFNYSNNTFWMGLGGTTTPAWIGAGVCGASGGIAAGLTYQIPTLGAVKDYFSAVSSAFLGTTASYVATFNGATGAVTGVSSFNGLTGAVTGASLGANTFTGLQTLNAGLTTSFAHVSGGLTVGGSLYVNGNLTVSGGVTTSISEIVLIEDNIITLNSNVTGTPTENAGIEIERGTSANTQILWNESTDKWTFTNNGTLYYDIPTDYVSSFNGLTGAVGGVTTSAANTFTALQSFAQGVSSAGGTFDSLTVSTEIFASGTISGNDFSTGTYYRVDNGVYYSDYGLNSLGFFNGTRTQTWNPNFDTTNTTITFPAATTTLAGLSLAQTFTALNSFNAGISAAGATLSGTVTAPTPAIGTNNTQVATTAFVQNEIVADTVTTFNGRTGAVQGVSAAVAGSYITVSAATGSVTITNTGVQTFNGLTGAVTFTDYVTSFNGVTGAVGGVTTSVANTFTALQSFNSGISAAGATLSANTQIPAGATLTVDGNIVANGNVSLGNATSDTITSAADIRVNSLTVGRGGGGVSSNTAVGVSALASNSTGSINTAIGNTALTANTTGGSNVAVGDGALNANTTGSFNTAFGRRSLLNNNGSSNTAAGNGALSALSAGSFNTAIGRLTGNGVITATGGIYIGYSNIGTDLSTNEIVIGAQVVGFGSNTAVIGATTQTAAYIYGLVNAMGGVSAAGATLNGTVTAPTPAVGTNNTQVATTAFVQNEIVADTVTTFNGRTGAVQGVSSAAAGTGISISAATGAITITNTGVQTFNGLTGAVTGVTVGGANTFTALNSFNAGISSNGGTFSANTRFLSGIQTDSVLSTTGVGGTVYINSDSNGNGGNSITYIGDWNGTIGNGTSIIVDDQVAAINLNGNVGCSNTFTALDLVATRDFYFGGSAILSSETSALGTTAANQNIGTVVVFNGSVDTNRSVEFFVQASHSSGYEALKIMVIHDGINTYNTQYGLIRTGPSLCSSYTTTIAAPGGNKVIRLRATPTNTNTTFKVVKTVIPA